MRLAVSIWKDRLSPVLDVAARLLVVSIDEGRELYRFEADITDLSITRTCQLLKHLEIETLICGAISGVYLKALRDSGFCVIPEVAGTVSAVVTAFIEGKLQQSELFLPGHLNGTIKGKTPSKPARPADDRTDGTPGIDS
ncbi:MAG: hypothetical protein ABIL58_16185 [Pseudomonadota bacterium]